MTVCLAGGEREVAIIGSSLRRALRLAGNTNTQVDERLPIKLLEEVSPFLREPLCSMRSFQKRVSAFIGG